MSSKDFVIISELGKGSYSSVYRVRRISDDKEYALKKVKLLSLKEKEKSNALNEVRLLASISSEFIVSYKEAFLEDASNSLCIVMEFADGGDLQQRIDKTTKKRAHFSETEVWQMIKDVLSGLKVLHDMKIMHRDIKTANIFISGPHYKLGDLNVSKIMERGLAYTQTGTPYYASPEVWRDEPYDNKSDIWSLGCVIYEVCALKPPFQAKDMQGLYRKVQAGRFDRIPNIYSQELQKFVEACLQLNASKRPTCEQLLRSPMISQSQDSSPEHNNLLDTIKIPRNLQYLKGMLPKSKYQQTETSTERIPSRKSDQASISRQQKVYSYIKKNGSEKSMLPEQPSRIIPTNTNKSPDDYGSYLKKLEEGSYNLDRRNRISSEQKHTNPSYNKMEALSNLQRMNQQLEDRLLLKEKNLLGGLPRHEYSQGLKHGQEGTSSVKLPPIDDRQRVGAVSLRANRANYEYNRPNWWG